MNTINDVQKFITINDNNIQLINPITKPYKIISFIGDARIGKSTLINCFISFLCNKNINMFKSSNNSKDHCTVGIDMLLLETDDYNLIILDVQGLNFKESKDDCKILLFVFMISNLIIYNQKDILKNNVLSTFQSLTSLTIYLIDNNIKPSLLFRPIDIDYDSNYDPNENLNDMLSDTTIDQYSSVRESIKKLFSPILCKPTFSLERNDKHLLKSNNLLGFMEIEENGFKDFCIYLKNQINSISSNFENLNIENIIQQINTNQNINYKIFDTTYLQAELAINKFINSIDSSKYKLELYVDGTTQNYNDIIQTRMDYRDHILEKYDNQFKLTTPKIRDKNRQEIKAKFDKVINKAILKTEEIADTEIKKLFKENISEQIFEFLLDPTDTIECDFFNVIGILEESPYLESIKKKYNLDNVIAKIITFINSLHLSACKKYSSYIQDQVSKRHEYIESFTKDSIYLDNINNIEKSFQQIVKEYISKLDFSIEYDLEWVELYIDFNKESGIHFRREFKIDDSDYLIDDINSKILSIIGNSDPSIIIETKYKEEFETIRKSILPHILMDLQKDDDNDIEEYGYDKIKESYEKTLKLYNKIKKHNKVQFLNIFPYLVENKSECEKKWSKYTLLINQIHKIYTIDEFKLVYKDILPFYQTKYNDSINFHCSKIIIDKLFKKYIITNYEDNEYIDDSFIVDDENDDENSIDMTWLSTRPSDIGIITNSGNIYYNYNDNDVK